MSRLCLLLTVLSGCPASVGCLHVFCIYYTAFVSCVSVMSFMSVVCVWCLCVLCICSDSVSRISVAILSWTSGFCLYFVFQFLLWFFVMHYISVGVLCVVCLADTTEAVTRSALPTLV